MNNTEARYDEEKDEIIKTVTTEVAVPYVQIENEYNNLCTERDAILARIAELEPLINLK